MASDRNVLQSPLPKIRPILLGLCLVCLPALTNAKTSCLWMNEATASGLLGGDSVGTFTEATAGQPAVCTFTQQGKGTLRTLRITVAVASDPLASLGALARVCGADAAPLKAIGNEALTCSTDEHKGGHGRWVIGRVRDQVFTIRLSSLLKDDPVLNPDTLMARAYTAAEQVSGNLF